jgi:GT2 family glycosyltransferase
MSDPQVSVVMVTKDRREQALRTLARLSGLPERPPVIVVDNASTDGTADAAARRFPAVTVVRSGVNLGACGRNLGVDRATTRYVAFSDDDSWWSPGSLPRAAGHLDAAPRLGLLAARILVGPGHRPDPTCLRMAASPLPRAADLPGPSLLGFVACGAVVRRRAFLQVGGFHPTLLLGGEETLLAWDLAAAGWGLAYVEDVVAHHHPTPNPDRRDRRRLELRNRLLASWLRRPLRRAVSDTFGLARLGADPDARRALAGAARRAPAALADRRLLPPYIETQVCLLERSGG